MDVINNAKRNIIFGIANKAVLLLCPFVERTIVQIVLGEKYLGLSSLFTSVLSVLSLSELGFNSAMIYNMHKPMAEGNTKKINALLNLYKKVYRVIGCVIIVIGLMIVPFLPHLIKGTYPSNININRIYFVYLVNSVLSYFLFAYMTSIAVASQRDDVQSIVNSIVKIGLTVSEVVILLTTKSYYMFIMLMPIFTIINNLWVAWRIHKLFPEYKPEGYINNNERKNIKKLATGTFIQRACAVTRNSLDSICISSFLGLTYTAIYNNYYMILQGVTVFISVISTAFLGGVGNHVAVKSVEENFEELQKLNFICTVCLICLYQPFMQLWMGERMMLDFPVVILLCVYFYMLKLGDMITLYSSANGLWWKQRYRAIGETAMNILLNIILGRSFGIYGIVIATMISLFVCNYIWATGIVFKAYFTTSRRKVYYLNQAKQTLVTLIACILSFYLCICLSTNNWILMLIGRSIICLVIPNVIYILLYRKTDEFLYIKKLFFKN